MQAVAVEQRTAPMYNLEVAGAHTFFVGDQRWLVHNDCGRDTRGAAKLLRRNMRDAGVTAPDGTAAHHIVAHGDRRAAGSRAILAAAGISPNAAINGVFLSTAQHRTTLSTVCHNEVRRPLENAAPGTIPEVLQQIAQEMQAGTFPH